MARGRSLDGQLWTNESSVIFLSLDIHEGGVACAWRFGVSEHGGLVVARRSVDQELVLLSWFAAPSFIFTLSLLFFLLLLRFGHGDEEEDQPEAGDPESGRGWYFSVVSAANSNRRRCADTTRPPLRRVCVGGVGKTTSPPVPTWRSRSPPLAPARLRPFPGLAPSLRGASCALPACSKLTWLTEEHYRGGGAWRGRHRR